MKMKSIDTMVAKIPQMTTIERKNLRNNVQRLMAKDPDDTDAQKLKAALDAAEPEISGKRIKTGLLEWDPHQSDKTSFYGYFEGSAVARIFKRANHRNLDKDVYTLEVFRKKSGTYSQIAQARDAGEKAFSAREIT